MAYFVIHNSEGDTTVEEVTKEELESRLESEDPYYGTSDCLDKIPERSDTNYWEGKPLIIKGDIVVPRSVQVITKIEID